MAKAEWVRTALAINVAGSISAGARSRSISQPAASQQLAALELALGEPIFVRHRSGVTPTDAGARFLRQVSAPFEQIAWLLDGLDRGTVRQADPPALLGCAPDWFEHFFLPLFDGQVAVKARFGSEAELLDDLRSGAIDLAVTSQRPSSARVKVSSLGVTRYLLVSSPSLAPRSPVRSNSDLVDWITATQWVGLSEALPATRKFWQKVTGSLQPTRLVLIAADLRIVVSAVRRGLGASLLPSHVCVAGLESGELVEVVDVEEVVPSEEMLLSVNPKAEDKPAVRQIAEMLGRAAGADRG